MSRCVHLASMRTTEMNGPKPVCTSATKNANQSRPERLRAEGCRGGSSNGRRGARAPCRVKMLSCSAVSRPCRNAMVFSARSRWGSTLGAPSMTTGLPSLYSGASVTSARVRLTVIFGERFSSSAKWRALQATAILRLPTPKKPPKSITAARTTPSSLTKTSTIRPMSSPALLTTRFPITDASGRASGASGGVGGGTAPGSPPRARGTAWGLRAGEGAGLGCLGSVDLVDAW